MKKIFLITLVLILVASNTVSAQQYLSSNSYVNNFNFLGFLTDFNYDSIQSLTQSGFKTYYFDGEIVNNTIIHGFYRPGINGADEAYIEFPVHECSNHVVYEFRAKYVYSRSGYHWIIAVIKEQGYKFNYGVGYDVTFYHYPGTRGNTVYIFKGHGGLSTVWSKGASLPVNEWHVYKIVFDDYRISVYVDGNLVGSYYDSSKSYPLCGGFALMYEQGYGEAYFDWVKITVGKTVDGAPLLRFLNIEEK